MSGNIEHALITRVILDQDFHSLEKAQINENFFATPENREIFRFLKDTFHDPATVGLVPSLDMVRYRFPTFFPAVSVPDPVPILSQQLRQERVKMELLMLAQNLQQKAELNPIEALADLKTQALNISSISEVSQDLSMASAYQTLMEQYETVAQAGGIIGIPYPWAALNEATQGMKPEQFLVIFGRPKSMKSWLAIWIAVYAYIFARRRVLFYTREMSPLMVAGRVASAMAQVDYGAYLNGRLQPELKFKVFSMLKDLMEDERSASLYGQRQPYFLITSDRSGGKDAGGVSWLRAKIRELQPDLVIVDGMYLMKDDRTNQRTIDWKQIGHISQDLKLTAQEFSIPLIGVTQANRNAQKSKGEDLTELSFSDSLGMDADGVYRVSKEVIVNELGVKETELWIKAPGLREGVFDGMVIHGQPATNFGFKRLILDSDTPQEGGYNKKEENGAPRAAFRKQPQQFMDPKINLSRR